MKLLRVCKLAVRLLRRNWKTIVAFEALYKLSTAFLVTPFLFGLLNVSIRVSGLTYLSNNTIRAYLLNPFSIALLLLILLLITFVTLIDIEAVICCCHAAYYDQRLSLWQMFTAGFTKARRVFHRKNALAVLFVLLIIPLTNVAAVSGYVSSLEVPEFIQDFIGANTVLHLLYLLVQAALVLLAFIWALSLQVFTLEDVSFPEAAKRSAVLMRGRYIRTALGALLWETVLLLAGLAVGAVAAGIAFLGIRFLCPADMQYAAATTTMLLLAAAINILTSQLSVPFVFAHLSASYYSYMAETGRTVRAPEAFKPLQLSRKARRALVTALCLAVVGNAVLLIVQQYNGFQDMRRLLNRPAIAAHRGSSFTAPENSIPAFEQAIREGADWIELDVHQTKDRVVVVAHDESIKRIAGVDKDIWAMTYDELAGYDVGAWFSPAYSGLKIATLDEVLKLCKGKIKLNIELKPTGHEPDFERNVIDLIRENGYQEGDYVVASLNADALRTVKAIDPTVETLFIMAIAAGRVVDIPFADAFSIEETSINKALVKRIHAADKQIHAWTVNREENATRMMELRVDCIISDNPVMIRQVMDAKDLQEGLKQVITLFFQPPDEVVVHPEIADSP